MAKNPKAIVSVTNDLLTDNRVDKVCRFLVDQGYTVTLVGRRMKSSSDIPERPYRTKRFRLLAESGPRFYASYNCRLFFYLLFHPAKLHRGANAHPVGKLISEGGWPGIARSLCEPVTSTRGIESNKPIVYG